MWDSSDPYRDPRPLPLPDKDVPLSSIKTGSFVTAAHRRIGSTNSSRNLALPEPQDEMRLLLDTVTVINSNLEILMKRSQNNARDLGKLRGDVKNPQLVEEIRKILSQNSSISPHYVESDDSGSESAKLCQNAERQREFEQDLQNKLEAILRLTPSAQTSPALPLAPVAVDDIRVLEAIAKLSSRLDNFSCQYPAPLPTAMAIAPPILPSNFGADIFADLEKRLAAKVGSLQDMDTLLLERRSELASLEARAIVLTEKMGLLLIKSSEIMVAQTAAQQKKEISPRKAQPPRRPVSPLKPINPDRRYASLSNIRNVGPPFPSVVLAPPLRHHNSHMATSPETSPTPFKPSNLSPGQLPPNYQAAVPGSPKRSSSSSGKLSWSRRVSAIFSGGNKENVTIRNDSERTDVFVPMSLVEKPETMAGAYPETPGKGYVDDRSKEKTFRSLSTRS